MRKMVSKFSIGRWMIFVFCTMGLAISCFYAVTFIFGGGTFQPAAQLEANRLADAELSELIGTTQYDSQTAIAQKTFFQWIAETLRLPFIHPEQMLSSQLPAQSLTSNLNGGSQANLLQSISTWVNTSRKIALGWMPDESVMESEHLISENPGVNVISPTWLALQNSAGAISNLVEPQVVQYAHAHHVRVWALMDNQFRSNLTHQFLTNPTAEQHVITQLVNISTTNHLDGINIDFENMETSDRDAFTSFIANLHHALQLHHIDLSVDITPDIVLFQDDAAYFHAGLAGVCDQVILMAYDEHWASDQTPGPVADVPWVTNAVSDLLSTGVPSDKLVLGLPFYTRFWHVTKNSVSSEAVALGDVASILKAHHAIPKWDAALGEMYAKYPSPGGYEEVWYENNQTWADKLNLVNQDGLAGVAVWSLQLSNQSTWSTLIDSLRQSLS